MTLQCSPLSLTVHVNARVLILASGTIGMFFALPVVLPQLYDSANHSQLSVYARYLFELVQIVFSSSLEDADLQRADYLSTCLLQSTPVVFTDFGNKPKFHYALAHVATTLRRHGPSPYWSSFALESRLGDLKRACLLVANHKGVPKRGGDLIMEMYSLKRRSSVMKGTPRSLAQWVSECTNSSGHASPAAALSHFPELSAFSGGEAVCNLQRFESTAAAFSVNSFITRKHSPLRGSASAMFYVSDMCQVLSGPHAGSALVIVERFTADPELSAGVYWPLFVSSEDADIWCLSAAAFVTVCRTLQMDSQGEKECFACLYW